MPPALVLALFALTNEDSPMLLYMIVGGLMALGPVLNSYARFFDWLKGKSVDVSLFVTKAELAAMRQERDQQIAQTIADIKADLDRVETLMTDLNRDLPAIHRALGRLEGHDRLDDAARLAEPRKAR